MSKGFLLIVILISGCSTNIETDCEPGKGMGCVSMSSVKKITQEKYGSERDKSPDLTINSRN